MLLSFWWMDFNVLMFVRKLHFSKLTQKLSLFKTYSICTQLFTNQNERFSSHLQGISP
jgi:hypothetical protein